MALVTAANPITEARVKAGLSVRDAARRAGVCDELIRRAERRPGAVSERLARRLAGLYGVNLNLFLYSLGGVSSVPASSRCRSGRGNCKSGCAASD